MPVRSFAPTAAVALLVTLAGCSQVDDSLTSSSTSASTSATATSSTTTSSSTENPPGNKTVEIPQGMEWTGCDGFALALDGPVAVYEGTQPAGWGPGESPDNAMSVKMYGCERVSWGPFERGPVFMLQEWQTNAAAPPKCEEDRPGPHRVLESIWFSDQEVADYARSTYGMPARYADFAATHSPVVPGQSPLDWTWTWTPPGEATSRVSIHDPVFGFNDTTDFSWRLYWGNGEGITYMDMDETYSRSSLSSGFSEGTLAPPMMWSQSGVSQFVGPLVNLELDASVSATFSRFGDAGCTKPL